MKRTIATLIATLALTMAIGTAGAELPEHGHIFVQRPVAEFLPDGPQGAGVYLVDYRKCVDLAGNQALTLRAQHTHLHFGTGGEALFEHAEHVVIPVAPFPGVPWTGCDDFGDFVPFLVPGQ